jgi:signal transduction histidine kinase/ligand-binding sensor domain-containing protein/CheY-like chemotaxis protein
MPAKTFFCCFFLFIVHVCCFAYERTPVTYLGIEQGLSNNAVTSIYQDHNGFMWFGTYDGLNRYDGYGFKVFRNGINDKNSLTDNHVSVIEGDASHKLWVGCEKGLSIYDPLNSRFSSPLFKWWNEAAAVPMQDGIRAIQKVTSGGSMLVGTQKTGLLMFEKGSQTGLQIPLTDWKGREGAYGVTAIAIDRSSQLAWIFIPQAGLCRFDIKRRTLRIINGAIKKGDCLKFDDSGNLWLGNEDGLFKYNVATGILSANLLPSKLKVVNLSVDKKGALWIASDGGGVWWLNVNGEKPEPYLSADGKPVVNSNAVYAVYEDTEGGKWIGTLRGGINAIQPRTSPFSLFTYHAPGQNNIINNFILSFCEDGSKNVWIGTDGAGLRYWDRQKNTFSQYVHDPSNPATLTSNFVTSIIRDAQENLWVATWFGGMNRLKKGAQSFEHFSFVNTKTGATEKNAWLVYEDRQKRLWASTTNEGTLYSFNRSKNEFELFDDNLSNLQCLLEDREGAFWGGDYSSLIKIDRTNKKHSSYKIGYTVRCIYEDRNKNFWIGTDGGGLLLYNRATGSYKRFTTADGLPSNTILRLLEDANNNLWLSTYNGICKFNAVSKTCRNFSQSDGLQSNQFSFNAALALTTGEFLFGGIKGFNVFYPDSVYERIAVPPVFLTGLKVNNKPVEEDDSYVTGRNVEKVESIRLSYDQATLSLDFLALDYTGADKVKYAYRLEGWDKTWNYVNNVRTANYSRLQEGDYTFKIKVANSAGVWSGETTLLTVTVLPPWYRTWWAYLLYASAIIGAVYAYVIHSKRQEKLKYEIKLALLEKEKEKELTEKKLSFFTNISHEFRTPLTLIINPIKDLLKRSETGEDHNELKAVNRNARRLLSLVDQLLIFRKAEKEAGNMKFAKQNFYTFCHEVFLCFTQQAKANNQEYFFECENHDLDLYIDRQKMEIALYNLLSNAIKFTPRGGRIVFSITELAGAVKVTVADTGCGIPAEAGSRLFEKFYQAPSGTAPAQSGFGIGLYLVRHFVEGHKGEISFQSEEGKGTSFIMTLQKGLAHFGDAVILNEPAAEAVSIKERQPEPELTEARMLPVTKEPHLDEVVTGRQTILVADDNGEIRQYLQQILGDKYKVLAAASGEEAFAQTQKSFPDLVISDIKMGEMSGIELCRRIKSDSALNHIPVILLTGSYGPDVELQSIEGGADIR